uniref:Chemosensory protein 36 n=1 Tax=Cnaphalocrocis medinalis TaxID=437488 RepID=A0A1P8SKC6_CNAME|nr:chemosensory protein 36 [Cnaphalocrocis medinalis]
MKVFLFTVMAVLAPMALCYDEKYDKIDMDKILGDNAMFTGYINCLLDKGPCELEYSADFRKLLPEVISTACANCTPIQKANVRKTAKAISEKPDQFQEFLTKYDPDHKHEKAFMAFVLENE